MDEPGDGGRKVFTSPTPASFTTTLANGSTITCNVTFNTTLSAGILDPGTVNAGSSATSCTTNLGATCTVAVTFNGLPWAAGDADPPGSSPNNRVRITSASFTAVFGGGASCTANGLSVTIGGNPILLASYPTTGCAASQARTRLTTGPNSTMTVTASNNPALVGLGATLSGLVQTPCAATALVSRMEA